MPIDDVDGQPDAATDPTGDDARAYLRRLAGVDGVAVVERAEAATEDLDEAVEFVEEVALERLARAVAAADDPEVVAPGERALAAFQRFRAAAAGEPVADALAGEHFRRGHDIDLRAGDEAPTE